MTIMTWEEFWEQDRPLLLREPQAWKSDYFKHRVATIRPKVVRINQDGTKTPVKRKDNP